MSPRRWLTSCSFAFALVPGACSSVFAELPPLIPRAVLFGNPARSQCTIAPDGRRYAYLAPSATGVLNVWVRSFDAVDDRMVTHDEHRGIRQYRWAEDERHLVYFQDVGGNENFHAYSVDLADSSVRDLTPFEGARAQNLMVDRGHPDQLLVGINHRDPKVFDVYRIDLASGAATMDTQNPGDVGEWFADSAFVIRAAVATRQGDGSQALRVRASRDAPWRDVMTWPSEENVSVIGFAPDGKSLYVESSVGSDLQRVLSVDAVTGATLETLASDLRCDAGPAEVDPATQRLQAVAFTFARQRWEVLDPAIRSAFEDLGQLHPGDFAVTSRDRADRKWIVAHTVDDGPVQYSLYDREHRIFTPLCVSQPELARYTLSRRDTLVIPTRDGQRMVSYMTLPVGVPPHALPMVLLPHGGPWARDTWRLDPVAQWLANRGYVVVEPNFRGSTGLGKRFLHLGDRQWGGTMQNDLSDAVAWAVSKGYADPKRVAIMGGSYGGYATLAGLAFTPQLYACGVDIVGPSNLKTLLEATPPYWSTIRKMLYLRMGDVDTDSLFNRRVSPLFHADRIRAPLLVGQGANDPRVNIRESSRMVAALRARGLPVEYVVYADEGHGFARPENSLDFFGRAEQFLAKHLGGRAEPWAPVPGSTGETR